MCVCLCVKEQDAHCPCHAARGVIRGQLSEVRSLHPQWVLGWNLGCRALNSQFTKEAIINQKSKMGLDTIMMVTSTTLLTYLERYSKLNLRKETS